MQNYSSGPFENQQVSNCKFTTIPTKISNFTIREKPAVDQYSILSEERKTTESAGTAEDQTGGETFAQSHQRRLPTQRKTG